MKDTDTSRTYHVSRQWVLDDFNYHLPESLIAQQPLPQRSASRMLVVDPRQMEMGFVDGHVTQLPHFLQPNDLVICNNTKVIAARLYGRKITGGQVELLIERICDEQSAWVHMRVSKKPSIGARIILQNDIVLQLVDHQGDLWKVIVMTDDNKLSIYDVLQQQGHMPLPPYIKRQADLSDKERYQTVYAKHQGAIAAPTAGLHFDQALLSACEQAAASISYITLHVGAGTFQPVRTDDISQHHMHSEWFEVTETVCDQIQLCHERGGRVVAIGTTVMRALETAAQSGQIQPFSGDSELFIYPGKPIHCVDALFTNFHLPRSSLLMLVAAFAGYEKMMQAYQHAVAQKYRFFSYGDAMFIPCKNI